MDADMSDVVVIAIALGYLAIGVVFGFLAAEAMEEKGRSSMGGFLLGFTCGPIGLIIALLYERTVANELERIDRIERARQSGSAPVTLTGRQSVSTASRSRHRPGRSRSGDDPVGQFLHSDERPQSPTVEAGNDDPLERQPREWGGDPLGRFLSDRERSTNPETESRDGDPK